MPSRVISWGPCRNVLVPIAVAGASELGFYGVHALASEFGVRVRGELSETQLQGILGGQLDSGAQLAIERCEPAGGEGANRWYQITVRGASGRVRR